MKTHVGLWIDHRKAVVVMGPGEAKGEFTTRLAREKGADRTVKMETADKMTNRQIAARVREYFKTESLVIFL